MPSMSIIVPCYNVEMYIRQCIESILAQDFTDYELILVNDGSPDRCGEIADAFARRDARVKVLHQENGGSAAARNSGLEAASGEYIYFIDPDDYISGSDFLGKIYHEVSENNVDMVLFNWTVLHVDGTLKEKPALPTAMVNRQPTGKALHSLVKSGYVPNSPWSRIMRRSIIVENNLFFDPFFRRNQDIEWNMRVYPVLRSIRVMNCPNYVYRLRDRNEKIGSERQQTHWQYRHTIIEKHFHRIVNDPSMDADLQKALLGLLARQWFLAISYVTWINDNKQRKNAIMQLSALKEVTKFALSRKEAILRGVISVFGIGVAGAMLAYYQERNRR